MTTVALVGDSIAEGYYSADHLTQNYGVTMAARLGWTLFNQGESGTGFLVTPATTYIIRIATRLTPYVTPDVVIVQGSNNDFGAAGYTAAMLGSAVAAYCVAIRAAYPSLQLLVITAPPLKTRAPASVVSDATYNAAIAAMKAAIPAGDLWIDPIADNYFTADSWPVYGDSGGLHPKDAAAHAYLGTRMAFAIRPPATGLDY